MTPHIPGELPSRIDWNLLFGQHDPEILKEGEEEEEEHANGPPVVREPDED
jgi:hypothetical protein